MARKKRSRATTVVPTTCAASVNDSTTQLATPPQRETNFSAAAFERFQRRMALVDNTRGCESNTALDEMIAAYEELGHHLPRTQPRPRSARVAVFSMHAFADACEPSECDLDPVVAFMVAVFATILSYELLVMDRIRRDYKTMVQFVAICIMAMAMYVKEELGPTNLARLQPVLRHMSPPLQSLYLILVYATARTMVLVWTIFNSAEASFRESKETIRTMVTETIQQILGHQRVENRSRPTIRAIRLCSMERVFTRHFEATGEDDCGKVAKPATLDPATMHKATPPLIYPAARLPAPMCSLEEL